MNTILNLSSQDLIHLTYNCLDTIYTYESSLAMEEELTSRSDKLQSLHTFQQEKVNYYLLKIMNRGVRVDLDKKALLSKQLTKLMEEVENKFTYIIGEPFNPRSSTQMKAVYKDLLGVNLIKDPKSHSESCASQYMFKYMEQYPEYKLLTTLILEYRSLGVFLKTFVNAKVDEDGRLRTSFNCAGTKTGRLSSKKTPFNTGLNFQNIPSKGKIKLKYALSEMEDEENSEKGVDIDEEAEGVTELPNCKEFFIPDPNYTMFNIDFEGADAQIVAYESDCEWLINFFKAPPMKLYQYIASYYLQREISTSDKWYKIFKQFCHGTNYGMMEAKAAINAGIDLKDAKEIRKWYFALCPEIPEWHKEIENKCKTQGYIENIFGRQLWFLNKDCPTWLNQAIASIPQSTIGDLTNRGLVNIEEKYEQNLTSAHVLFQVHDSLAGQYLTSDLTAPEIIKQSMLIELPYKLPLIIGVDLETSSISYGHCS